MNQQELKEKIARFREIGPQIEALSEESKTLRSEIASGVDELNLGHIPVNEDEEVEFIVDNVRVSVRKQRDRKDYTILMRELKIVE